MDAQILTLNLSDETIANLIGIKKPGDKFNLDVEVQLDESNDEVAKLTVLSAVPTGSETPVEEVESAVPDTAVGVVMSEEGY